jgi:hypothetical protein
LDVGESPLDLTDVETCNSDYVFFHCSVDAMASYYFGPAVIFNDIAFNPGRSVNMKTYDSLCIETMYENTAELPLMVRVRYDITGNGWWHTFYCGQSYRTVAPPPEYLYVNEYIPWLMMWNTYGADPWLDAPGDGNYVEMGPDGTLAGVWGFDDINLAGRLIDRVILEGYTNAPYDEGVDFDIYSAFDFGWLGSLYGTGAPAWVGVRWTTDYVTDVCPWTATESGLNGFMVLGYSYYGTGVGEILDCLRLKVEFAKVAPVVPPSDWLLPGEMGSCEGCWILDGMTDKGKFVGKATVQFSLNGATWVSAAKRTVKDFHLKIFQSGK